MQNMKKLIAMMLMLASVFFIACEEDDEKEKLSKEEAIIEITQLSDDLSDKLDEMENAEGLVAMEALTTLVDPFQNKKSDKKTAVLNNIQKYLLPQNYVKKSTKKAVNGTEPFNFDQWVGTYTWNNTYGMWDIQHGVPTDKIIIIFPADTNNLDNNNATITIHNYDEVLIEDEYMPTDIDADLYISEIEIVNIDLTAVWFETGEYIGEPTSLDVSVYLIPFEFTGDFTHTNTEASIDFAINYNTETFFAAGVGATWANDGDSIPSNINGYLQLFHVKLQADVDLADIIEIVSNLSEYSDQDEALEAINDEIDAYVTVNDTWAADIELDLVPSEVEGEDDEMDIVFVYADGTSESAIPYFEELADDLEVFFNDLEEYYGNW